MRLELSNVTKRFGEQVVLDRTSLSIIGKQVVVLLGPSGGGKSTLLRILAGLIVPDEGVVTVEGKVLARHEAGLREHRRKVGTVFQAFNLFPHLTAAENIALPLRQVHGQSKNEAMDRTETLLRRFRLLDHAQKKPAALSGGQKQRVAIARAVSFRPDLILLDEPTSALDPEMTGEVLDMIAELREEGRDLVIVTHEIGFAREVADYAVLLVGGQIAAQGESQAFFSEPPNEAASRFLQSTSRYGVISDRTAVREAM